LATTARSVPPKQKERSSRIIEHPAR
jgi:hypothetical protein